jgi:hypothetical protein
MGKGYDLASVHSDNEQAFLVTVLADNEPADDIVYEFWIGLHDWIYDDYTQKMMWSDESPVDYINWADGEPNNLIDYDSEEHCVEMYAHNDHDIGHWNDFPCDNELPYICRVKASEEHHTPPDTKKCVEEFGTFDKFLDGCYKWHGGDGEAKNWLEAENLCKTYGSSHLASILTVSEQAFVLNEVQSEMAWIGLSDKSV